MGMHLAQKGEAVGESAMPPRISEQIQSVPMRFVAIDVETANADMASICAAGEAVFEQGRLSSEWVFANRPGRSL